MSRVGRLGARVRLGAVFAVTYAAEFLVANAQVVREVLTPGSGVEPALLRQELAGRTPLEVASIAALVGLTPGTVVVDVDDPREVERPCMTVHVMFAHDLAEQHRALAALERRLLAALRGVR
ncbi:Na+/H+ antiporter subunit E [Quadrisphaera sp. KR29]|uniref:Na+/H+ antiporter subunit E n=1 Tax=Quadrisphaera sp. KR29 TaxID=3461391 RepID=UPI004044E430